MADTGVGEGAPPPPPNEALAINTASLEAPAVAPIIPEVAVAEVALEAAQTDAHAGIQGLAGAEAQSVDYSKGIDARKADPALMEAFREEVKQANASGEDRPYADMLAKAQARAAETVDKTVIQPPEKHRVSQFSNYGKSKCGISDSLDC